MLSLKVDQQTEGQKNGTLLKCHELGGDFFTSTGGVVLWSGAFLVCDGSVGVHGWVMVV